MPSSGHLDITQQDFFEQVIARNENRARAIVQSHRGTGEIPPRLGLLTVRNADGHTAEDVAASLAPGSCAHKAIHDFLRGQRLHMAYFESAGIGLKSVQSMAECTMFATRSSRWECHGSGTRLLVM
jgi:hypothetical protein